MSAVLHQAKSYQPVLGALRSKLLFCTLLRLISRYLKQNLWVFAKFFLTSDLKWPGVTLSLTYVEDIFSAGVWCEWTSEKTTITSIIPLKYNVFEIFFAVTFCFFITVALGRFCFLETILYLPCTRTVHMRSQSFIYVHRSYMLTDGV